MSQADAGAVVAVPPGGRRKWSKAELDGLRERMHGLGLACDEIAAETGDADARPVTVGRLAMGRDTAPEKAAREVTAR